jgi:hypothetical protein
MAHETGLTVDEAQRALADVCALGIAKYDPDAELVYLPEGAKYQIGESLKPGDKRVRGIEAALAQLNGHPYAADFASRYAAEFCLRSPIQGPPEAPSKPHPGSTGSPFEARQGTGKEQEQAHASRAGERAQGDGEGEPEDDDPEPTSDTTNGQILVALRSHPALAQYEQEGLRLVQCALDLTVEAGNYVLGGKIRQEDVMERVAAAISDAAGKAKASGATTSPMPPAKVAHLLTTFARANLAKPRDVWAAEKSRGRTAGQARSGPTAPDPAKVAFVPPSPSDGPVWGADLAETP